MHRLRWWPAAILLTIVAAGGAAEKLPKLGSVYAARDSLADVRETTEDARRCLESLAWPAADFKVFCHESGTQEYDFLVRFPSPVPSGDQPNDLVAMEWYVARDEQSEPMMAPAVVVVHESHSKMVVGRLFASRLQKLGLHTFLIHLPYFGQRECGGRTSAAVRMVSNPRQAVADVRRARDAVAVLPLVDAGNVALQGTSLGGFVSATAASLDGCFDSVFLMLAGGDLHGVIQKGRKNARKLRAELHAHGVEGEKLQALLWTVEPIRVAHRLDPTRTWLYWAAGDTVVPPENTRSLAEAARLDAHHHIRLPGNHYSAIVYLPAVVRDVARQIVSVQR